MGEVRIPLTYKYPERAGLGGIYGVIVSTIIEPLSAGGINGGKTGIIVASLYGR
jgi:hypothetical protein